VVILTIPSTAQQTKNLFDDLTSKYADQEVLVQHVNQRHVWLYIKKKNLDESSPVFEALKKLNYITVISQSKFFTEALKAGVAKDNPENKNVIHETILNTTAKMGTHFLKPKEAGRRCKGFLNEKPGQNSVACIDNQFWVSH